MSVLLIVLPHTCHMSNIHQMNGLLSHSENKIKLLIDLCEDYIDQRVSTVAPQAALEKHVLNFSNQNNMKPKQE